MTLTISIRKDADDAANPVRANPRALSDELKLLGVTRSVNIHVDEVGASHEFRVKDGAWKRLLVD